MHARLLMLIVILITNFISVSGIMQNENIVKISRKEFLTVSANVNDPSNKNDKTKNILNNKWLRYDKAIKNKNVVMINFSNPASSKTHNTQV